MKMRGNKLWIWKGEKLEVRRLVRILSIEDIRNQGLNWVMKVEEEMRRVG